MHGSFKKLRVAVAQLNPIVGDIAGNLQKARFARAIAAEKKADLIVFTELFLSAYPPQDLLFYSSFLDSCEKALLALVSDTSDEGPGLIIGVPLKRENKIYNAFVVADSGKILLESFKVDLPEYDEFNEKRFFSPGLFCGKPIYFRGVFLGISICEDIWGDSDVCMQQKEQGADILVAINASPFYRGKNAQRYAIVRQRVEQTGLPFLYVNQVGGQDELVFDGASFALSTKGDLVFQMPHFQESIDIIDWQFSGTDWVCVNQEPILHTLAVEEEADYRACMLGLHDYVIKNKFKTVLLGLSGGIDSVFCATLAVDTFGAESVQAVMMPFLYTSQQSLQDARHHAQRMNFRYDELSIEGIVESFENNLLPMIGTMDKPSITYENLQSRARGVLLMALSNHFGSMLLSTSNKSEISVGYGTLYGDMNGGFNPLKDLYKTHLLALASWRNQHVPIGSFGPEGIVIPETIMRKPASAELSPNQFDQDILPPYPILDSILECFIEKRMRIEDIVAKGYERSMVLFIENLIFLAEYKRRQAPLGVKLTPRSFNSDRRYPITNFFRGV